MNGRRGRDRHSYLDELSPSRGADPASSPVAKPQAVVPTLGQGFDRTTIATVLDAVTVSGNSQYPQFDILTVPEQIERATITGLSVSGDPLGFFLKNCWWTLNVQTGPLQEWQPSTNVDMTNTGVAAPVPALAGGVRYSSFGSLAQPRPVSIRLSPRSVLRLQLFATGIGLTGNAAVPITVYVRVVGVIHYQRGL